jgi:hypothetical protein
MITNADLLSFECRNNFSARSQPAIIKDLIDKECRDRGYSFAAMVLLMSRRTSFVAIKNWMT